MTLHMNGAGYCPGGGPAEVIPVRLRGAAIAKPKSLTFGLDPFGRREAEEPSRQSCLV